MPSKEAPAAILTAETIPAYLRERAADLSAVVTEADLASVKVQPILGGNVNYAFSLTFESGKPPLFLKQAPEFVAVFGPDGLPLTSERMQREMDVYAEWKTLLGEPYASDYLPQIHYFDKSHMAVLMQFLDGYTLLDHVLVEKAGEYSDRVATALGDFMGRTHAATHASQISPERKAYLTEHFANPEMRDIQLEYVFTKCYKESTDEQRAGLQVTPEFLEQVELLKTQYKGENTTSLVLTHGDLHPGSVMVNSAGDTKVIDPEFTVYGPPGLDVGSLLSGYCLGAIHQAHSNNPTAVRRIVQGGRDIWQAYVAAMQKGGITDPAVLKAIEIETVGFTVAEVCRTALEFAGGRKWLQFENPDTKAAANKDALRVVDKCMIARHTGGIELLWEQMEAVTARPQQCNAL